MKPSTLWVAAMLLFQIEAVAYDPTTHQKISEVATTASDLGNSPQLLRRLGLQPLPVDSASQAFPYFEIGSIYFPKETVSIIGLVAFGSYWEDKRGDLQALRHFYDPATGSALHLPLAGTGLTIASPDWALEDLHQFEGPAAWQQFSYHDARQYFYRALTSPTREDRYGNWGLTFQSLGQIIHHLQDMAQPQHVRNDPHCDSAVCKSAADAIALYLGSQTGDWFYHPSLYEQWAVKHRPADAVFLGYAPVSSGREANIFRRPRAFWTTTNPTGDSGNGVDGSGISEFTHRNVFSQRTIAEPPHLSSNPYWVDIGTICAEATAHDEPPCPDEFASSDLVAFVSTNVTDTLRPETNATNARAATLSIFDEDLIARGSPPQYALNRFNFEAAYSFLLPRAVGYSAGLINYFFRGRLKISLPDQGVYAMVDHALPSGNDPILGGFPAIKLSVQNVTPSGENIPDGDGAPGRLVAVAKFHRNQCYASNLSGEYGSPGVNGMSCRSPVEEVVVSGEQLVPAGINQGPVAVTFRFMNGVIPISATDLFLQVIYRGPLGEERESVIVETHDISEPTYLYQHTMWDQIHFCSSWPLVPEPEKTCTGPPNFAEFWCPGGYPQSTNPDGTLNNDACNQAMGLTVKIQYSKDQTPIPGYDPSHGSYPFPGALYPLSQEPPFNPIATLVAPVGTLPRVAALFDVPQEAEDPAPSPNTAVYVQELKDSTHDEYHFEWLVASARPTINQMDTHTTTPTLISSIAYGGARGVYVNSVDVPLLQPPPGATYTFPPLVLGPSIFSRTAGAWYWPN